MTKKYRRSGAATVDRVAEARERLATMTVQLTDSTEFRAFLKMRAKFHRYSLNNTFLIAVQRPGATAVKGFKGWLELGRQVRKGEKAIYILAPRPYKRTEEDADGTEVEVARVAYGTAAVFDISQTDPVPGHPNPFELPARISVAGDDDAGRHLFSLLTALLDAEGVTVSTGPAKRGESGYYQPKAKAIHITAGQAPAEAFAVLAHEAGHHFSMAVEDHGNYAQGEVIAESIAFLLCDHFGLDATQASPDYLAHWIKDDKTKLDVAVDHIVSTATRLIDELTDALNGAAAPLAA